MRTITIFALACLTAPQALLAQVYTEPAGYVSINVPANSDTTVTAPLHRPTVYSGSSTSISGDVVGVSGLTAGAFVTPACYMQVTSGPLEGVIFPIIANTTSSITVEAGVSTLQALGFLSGNAFDVIPYWTLATLFPAGAGVGSNSDALSPTSFVLAYNSPGVGTNRASGQVFFYCSGDTELGLPAGWYDNADPFAGTVDNTQIDPAIQYVIRSVNASQVVISGSIPTTKTTTEIVFSTVSNDNHLSAPYPVDTSLQESGLQSVIAATSDALSPTEFVFTYNDTAAGKNKSASNAYFYCSGDTELGLPAGWYDNADPFAGVVTAKVLKAGRCFVLRKKPYVSAGIVDWTANLPYAP